MMKDIKGFRDNVWPMCQLWDTQLAEYILTGQVKQYANLDGLSEKYGGTLKDDQCKDFCDEGVMTEDIPNEIIIPYLKNDVLNTEIVFKAQYQKAKELGMLELIKVQMTALKATTEMEWNGMHFDKEIAKKYAIELGDLKYEAASVCDMEAQTLFPHEFWENRWNMGSTAHVATALFGGEYKYKAQRPILDEDGNTTAYKSGVRSEEHTSELQSHHDLVCRLLLEKKKQNVGLNIIAE